MTMRLRDSAVYTILGAAIIALKLVSAGLASRGADVRLQQPEAGSDASALSVNNEVGRSNMVGGVESVEGIETAGLDRPIQLLSSDGRH